MLNGVAPILIFRISSILELPSFNAIEGIPLVGAELGAAGGFPIPIYLDERLSGICLDTDSKAIDVTTNPQQRNDGGPPEVDQKGINSIVTVNMSAQKDSILLSSLIALIDIVFQRLVAKDCSITYLNGPTTVFNGLLHGFSVQPGSDDDLLRVTLQISKANQQGTLPKPRLATTGRVRATLPTGGPSEL